MSIESELKIQVAELEGVRERLRAANAVLVHEALRELNLIFDSRHRELSSAGRVLRLRTIGERALLTLKGPVRFLGRIKQREEFELELSDALSMVAVLERLGYQEHMRYEKDRESWRVGAATVTLDHTPLGDFAEIEGPEDEIERVAVSIGLDPSAAVRGSYPSLWQDYRSRHPELELPADMVFSQ
jgi:adenylate cyclase class 2